MKKSELRKIIKEEISKALSNPWTGQGELFDAPEQYDMTGPQKEAYEAWKTAVDEKYGDVFTLYPNDGGKSNYIKFDLKRKNMAIRDWITIIDDGSVSLPISFYRMNFEDHPEWMYHGGGRSKRPLTMNDVPEIVAGLEEQP
tara:strand:- start:7486 stop:7911 length:426 start_codon:yes stop_codon:yes gene_type:complete